MTMNRVLHRRSPPCPDRVGPAPSDALPETTWQAVQERRFVALQAACARHEWELAEWFVRPPVHLAGRLPVSLLGGDPCAVNEAARMDHFINRW
jgi:hypothetical protein